MERESERGERERTHTRARAGVAEQFLYSMLAQTQVAVGWSLAELSVSRQKDRTGLLECFWSNNVLTKQNKYN